VRAVVMTIVDTSPTSECWWPPVIWAISDALNANILNGFGDRWLTAMDGINLGEMFERASATVASRSAQRHCNVNLRTDAAALCRPAARAKGGPAPSRSAGVPAWRHKRFRDRWWRSPHWHGTARRRMDPRACRFLKSDRLTQNSNRKAHGMRRLLMLLICNGGDQPAYADTVNPLRLRSGRF